VLAIEGSFISQVFNLEPMQQVIDSRLYNWSFCTDIDLAKLAHIAWRILPAFDPKWM